MHSLKDIPQKLYNWPLDKILRPQAHLSPGEQTETRKHSLTPVPLVPEYSTMIDLWFLSLRTLEAARHEKSEKPSKSRE